MWWPGEVNDTSAVVDGEERGGEGRGGEGRGGEREGRAGQGRAGVVEAIVCRSYRYTTQVDTLVHPRLHDHYAFPASALLPSFLPSFSRLTLPSHSFSRLTLPSQLLFALLLVFVVLVLALAQALALMNT